MTKVVFHVGNAGHKDGDLVKLYVMIDGEFREVASGPYDAKNKVVVISLDETVPATLKFIRHLWTYGVFPTTS